MYATQNVTKNEPTLMKTRLNRETLITNRATNRLVTLGLLFDTEL